MATGRTLALLVGAGLALAGVARADETVPSVAPMDPAAARPAGFSIFSTAISPRPQAAETPGTPLDIRPAIVAMPVAGKVEATPKLVKVPLPPVPVRPRAAEPESVATASVDGGGGEATKTAAAPARAGAAAVFVASPPPPSTEAVATLSGSAARGRTGTGGSGTFTSFGVASTLPATGMATIAGRMSSGVPGVSAACGRGEIAVEKIENPAGRAAAGSIGATDGTVSSARATPASASPAPTRSASVRPVAMNRAPGPNP